MLQSFPVPRPDTNPYTSLLERSLRAQPGLTSLNFTWRTALFGRYDVFHAHWPEILVNGHSPVKKLVRQALFVLFLLRLTVRRTAVVRTVHNVGLPSGISRREVWLLGLFERVTTMRIRLNPLTEMPAGSEFATIPLGHFRDWYTGIPTSAVQRGRLCYYGTIRRYKGVEGLITAFRGLSDASAPAPEGVTLVVAGRPSTPDLAATMVELAGGDPRITLDLRGLSDTEVVELATSSELVIMPYRFMHNSAAVLTVLSLDRPLLVPDNEVNRMLSDETGPGWLHLYRDELSADDLLKALQEVRDHPPAARPNLDARGWTQAAISHAQAYRRAVSLRRRTRR